MRDEGDLAKFAIARLCGHFRSRGLQQNVVLCLYFKSIVMACARGCFFLALFLEDFPLVVSYIDVYVDNNISVVRTKR